MSAAPKTINPQSQPDLTRHAWRRMYGRGFSLAIIDLALCYGRVVHVRGATIHVVGRKEVERCRQDGIDLSSVEGIQVVCADSGAILTVYRNRDLRALRPRSRRARRHARQAMI
jgi:hypothetical protein